MTLLDADKVRNHYDNTIDEYDILHGDAQDPEHIVCLDMFWRFARPLVPVTSVLDVGCGTGRGLKWIAEREPTVALSGIDPSPEMCKRASRMVPQAKISTGDGASLAFRDASFDVVIATGIMHHIGETKPVLQEMFRVARHAVIVSDHNDFAMGSRKSRRARVALQSLGLLRPLNYILQGFRHRRFSKEDGWFYPYSLLEDYDTFADNSSQVLLFPTRIRGTPNGNSLALRQSHLALIGLK